MNQRSLCLLRYRRIIHVSLFSLFILGLNPKNLTAQDRQKLEQERLEIIRRIENADKELSSISSSKKATQSEIRAWERKIKDREKLISNIQNDLVLAEAALQKNQRKHGVLVEDLDRVKERYYGLLNAAYKQHLSYNKWAFILNAKSLNDSFQRWQYVKQYEAYCQEAYADIKATSEVVSQSSEKLNQSILERQKLLDQESVQFEKIKEERLQLDEILKNLQSDEVLVQTELASSKKQREALNTAIENAIIAALSGSSSTQTSTESSTADFDEKKGNLPWPVNNGYIKTTFGKQKHPSLKDIYIQNNGIDIQASIGSVAEAVHDGEVVGVNFMGSYGYTIIVKHQAYYTVYSKLDRTYVEKGEFVQVRQRLGSIDVDEEGKSTIHFEIWKGKNKLNPENWVKK